VADTKADECNELTLSEAGPDDAGVDIKPKTRRARMLSQRYLSDAGKTVV